MTPISDLLSQHEMLKSLCANLSNADIVHLAATSKENRSCITSRPQIYKLLHSNAICDGSDITAREKLFFGRRVQDEGPEDDDDIDDLCLGPDARPCSDCGVMVCNNCQFHFQYRCEEPGYYDEDDDFHLQEERDEVDVLEEWMTRTGKKCASIQISRAFDIFWKRREEIFCVKCLPPILPHTIDSDGCRCDWFNHFVGKRWLCIPYSLKEEVASIMRPRKTFTKYHTDFAANGYRTELTDCGHLRDRAHSCKVCTLCYKATEWDNHTANLHEEKIREQLGFQQEKDESMRELLEQLG